MIAGELAFDVRGAGYDIGARALLSDVGFTIRAGESVSIIGPNGAGKTTLLRCLAGLLPLTRGGIAVRGREIAAYGRRELARIIGYVPQSLGRMPSCSVLEFVLMARYAHFRGPFGPSRDDRRAAHSALEETGTQNLAGQSLDSLSGGERQQVLVAAALAQGAPVLVLDEPCAFLDYRHASELTALLERLNRRSGLTVISVSHDLNKGVFECDRVLALLDGRLVFNGPPAALSEPDQLERIYRVPFDVLRHPRTGRALVLPRRDAS